MPTIVLTGLILLCSSFVQGAIGFALGLIAIPLLVEAGFTLSQAVALATLSTGMGVAVGVSKLRQHILWQEVKLAAIVRLLTMPLGVLLLLSIENLDTAQVKQFVGFAVLFALIMRLLPRLQQREVPLPASIATFSLSGFLQGLIGMGGPPVVLWVTTRNFTSQQARVFTMTLSLINAPLQILLLLLLSEAMNLEIILRAGIVAPLIFLGTTLGVAVGNRFSKRLLNGLAMAVLLVIALNAIF